MRLTEKDRELMTAVEAWGFLTVRDVQAIMGVGATVAKWRTKRLVEAGLLEREKIFTGEYIYYTKSFKRLDIATFKHDQTAKRLAIKLSKELNCEYMTMRQIRSEERNLNGVLGLSRKIPDFVLIKNGQKIAIELELTQKDLKRQRKNIDNYITLLQKNEYQQVFYYCGNMGILNRLQTIIKMNNTSNLIRLSLLKDGRLDG